MTFEEIKQVKTIEETLTLLKVNPYMDFTEMYDIIYDKIITNCVVENSSGIKEIDYILVEIIKRVFILQNYTQLELPEVIEAELNLEIANWSNKIWDKLTNKIKNYNIFENILNKTIEQELGKLTKIEYKIIEGIDSLIKTMNNIDLKELASKLDPKIVSQITALIPKKEEIKN